MLILLSTFGDAARRHRPPYTSFAASFRRRGGNVNVRRTIDAARGGKLELDFRQQPPFGFHNVVYLRETHIGIPLSDPQRLLAGLQQMVAEYPPALQQAIISDYLWGVEFTLLLARDGAGRGDVYSTMGCLTRGLSYLTQVLFALNATYFISDKGSIEAIETFPLRPARYAARVTEILTRHTSAVELPAAVALLDALFRDTVALAGGRYAPRYAL